MQTFPFHSCSKTRTSGAGKIARTACGWLWFLSRRRSCVPCSSVEHDFSFVRIQFLSRPVTERWLPPAIRPLRSVRMVEPEAGSKCTHVPAGHGRHPRVATLVVAVVVWSRHSRPLGLSVLRASGQECPLYTSRERCAKRLGRQRADSAGFTGSWEPVFCARPERAKVGNKSWPNAARLTMKTTALPAVKNTHPTSNK